MSNRAPTPLPRPNSGDPTFDAAALALQTKFDDRKEDDVRAGFRRLNIEPQPGDDVRLLGLFVPEVFDFGGWGTWDDDVAAKMTPKERTAYKAEHDAAYKRHCTRERYFGWLVGKLSESAVGVPELVRTLTSKGLEPAARKPILQALAASLEPGVTQALFEAFPPETWASLGAGDTRLLSLLAERHIRSAREKAFESLHPLVAPATVDPDVVHAVLSGVLAASRPLESEDSVVTEEKLGIDARWVDVATAFLASKDAQVVKVATALLDACGVPEATSPKAPAKKPASEGPLPPARRTKAPKVVLPKSVTVATLAKQIDAMLAKAKLAKHRELLVQPALHVYPKRVHETKLALGASKIGGLPDLPAGTAWPENDGCPMGFVAQLRLEDVAKLGETRLPAKGLLYFFVSDEPFADGYLATARVLHVSSPEKLTRTPLPPAFQMHRAGKPMRQAYAACELVFVPTLTLPSPSNPAVTKKLAAKEVAAFEEHVQLEHDVASQVLGFRNHGYDAENPATAQLLFRMTTDAQADMEWGDAECLDIYVPKKDLAKGVFTNAYPYVGD